MHLVGVCYNTKQPKHHEQSNFYILQFLLDM